MSVLFVCVTYHSDDLAVRYARSIAGQVNAEPADLVVVDNAEGLADGGLRARLHAAHPPARWVAAPHNPGYFGGAAVGLAQFLETHALPNWVIVSNVDVEFRDPGFVASLRALAPEDNVGVLAPTIWSGRTGRNLNPMFVERPSRGSMRFRKHVLSTFVTFRLYEAMALMKRRLRAARPEPAASGWRDVYAPHGSCVVFARRYFECGGTLNHPAFLFSEEVFVAETARALRLRVVMEPSLVLWHDEHATTGLWRSRRMAALQGQAAAVVADRYFP